MAQTQPGKPGTSRMAEELSEQELEQLRKFTAFKRVSAGILARWRVVLAIVFMLATAMFSVYLVRKSARSINRYDATTRLLYTPRSATRVGSMGDKQMMGILDRGSLKRRVGNMVSLPAAERMCLGQDLEVKQEKKPTNLFTLTAFASTHKRAVAKVNAYAEVLIEEYSDFRIKDLMRHSDSLNMRKKTLMDSLAELDAEDAVAKSKAGVPAPVESLTMLNATISDQRRNYSMMSVELANEEVKKKRLESAVGEMGEAIIKCAGLIRKKSAQLAALDAEIAKLREVYTDLNPKVKGKLDDRKVVMDEFLEMLKENGIDGVSLEDVERVEISARELADVMLKLEVMMESQRTLASEIKMNEERAEVLTSVIPTLERTRVKREEIRRSMRELEEQQSDIDYLRLTAHSDLHQIERAGGAGGKNPMSAKNFIIAAGGAAVCTMALTFWVLVLELVFGNVRNAKELGAWDDVELIGSLPKPGAVDDALEKDVLGVVALNFCNAKSPKGVILVCRLPGAPKTDKFALTLDWSLAMAGQRLFVLEVVPSIGFDPPEGSETLVNTIKKGDRGWFPAANRYTLAPTEIQMFRADIATLRTEYDHVFVHMPDGLRRGGNFFGQLLGLCESAMIIIGSGKTPRSDLAYVREHVQSAGIPMMGLAALATAKIVRREMEEAR